MRGLVLDGTTFKISLLQAAAFVFVSGSNDPWSGGEPDNYSAPERTSANNDESDPSFVMDLLNPDCPLGADSGTAFLVHQTLASWFSPEVISTVTGQGAVPLGPKRDHSDVEGQPSMKKLRCSAPHELWGSSNAASSSEDRTLEDAFAAMETSAPQYCQTPSALATATDTAQQQTVSSGPSLTVSTDLSLAPLQDPSLLFAVCEDWASLGAWTESESPLGVATTTRPCDTGCGGAAPVRPAEATAEQQPDENRRQPTRLIRNVTSMPRQEDQAMSNLFPEALPFSMDPDQGISQGHAWASSALHKAPSTRHSEPCKEEKSAIYQAAKSLLLSPEGAEGVLKASLEESRLPFNTANAPYLSSSWLLERLARHQTSPYYLIELQTAFECYGHDNVSIPDLKQRALDLAYTLRQVRQRHVADSEPLKLRDEFLLLTAAADIIRDAFFSGRPLRPDLKTYLRNKLKTQHAGKYQLRAPLGLLRVQKGDLTLLDHDLRMIKRAIKLTPAISHPLNFIYFFTNVCTLVRYDHCLRRRVEETRASRNKTKPPTFMGSKGADAKSSKIIPIVTQYKKLFNVDLAAEIGALLEAAPDLQGPYQFQDAAEEGYVPSDLLQLRLGHGCGWYTLNAHCLLGSITALYRRLFESTDKTNDLGTPTTSRNSGSDKSCASDAKSKLNVVQRYLLQPLPTLDKEGTLNAEFDLLSAASKALKLWKPELNNFSNIPSIPYDIAFRLKLSSAPFGSSQWILAQSLQELNPEGDQKRRKELHFALDLYGYQPVNIRDVFARAFRLATAVLKHCEVPLNDVTEQVRSLRSFRSCVATLQGYVLAADIIQAALFHTWPQHQDLTKYFARHIRYEVLPEHKKCLEEVLAKRQKLYPSMVIRFQKGHKQVRRDWLKLQAAKTLALGNVEDNHPLSFDRFWNDVAMINGGHSLAIPEIASKYKVLFDRDIVEDLRCIREKAPQICHSNSFARGICEGYVPYRYAQLLTILDWNTLMVNKNALLFLGAIVDYYMSLVGPADATAPRETSTTLARDIWGTETLSSNNEINQDSKSARPDLEEEMAEMKAMLHRAPTQKRFTAGVAASDPVKKLHPVAEYLLGRSLMDAA
eukprot:Blabericola_migrator_1__13386@NODE_953_length_5905_cov_44_530319_g661_i0_p1_GENE_NODE_953_length_5905_cov_44_530319_g661_i0NODE_953_length_5905_cov_44_530319_g661_i0_p1_ORF_typecomplete_len1103_score185_72_NODE_953_length_5905_cov_44_530319_g661_i024725780